MGLDAVILAFWMLSFKPTFSLSSFTFIKWLFSSSLLSAIRVVSSECLRLLIFVLAILIPAWDPSSPAFLMVHSAYELNKQGTVYSLDALLSWCGASPSLHSSSNRCFFTCIQVSQEAGKVVWYSHLFKNCPQFVVIHTVKGFGIVNKAEIDIFGNVLAFSMIQQMLAIWSLVPLPFLNPACTSGSSQFTYCWSLAWRIFSVTLLVCDVSTIVPWFEHSLALPFLGLEWKLTFFQSCAHCWVFQICWHVQCSTLITSSFRIENGSARIPSPLLTLFVVMLD